MPFFFRSVYVFNYMLFMYGFCYVPFYLVMSLVRHVVRSLFICVFKFPYVVSGCFRYVSM